MTIRVSLMTRTDADLVTEDTAEDHEDMESAIRAAKRLAGTRRQMERADSMGGLRVTGPKGTAFVVR